MSKLCREVFEKHQAKLLNIDYQELKNQFDRHEKCFSKRYATFSDFEKEFELWQAAWGVRQAEIDQHQLEVHALGEGNLNQAMMLAKKQEEIDSLKTQFNNMEACYIALKKERDDVVYLKNEHRKRRCQLAKELTQKSLRLTDAEFEYKRIKELQAKDCLQIMRLTARNEKLSDELKALRGEHE